MPVKEVCNMEKSSQPVFGRKPSAIEQGTGCDAKGVNPFFCLAILSRTVGTCGFDLVVKVS